MNAALTDAIYDVLDGDAELSSLGFGVHRDRPPSGSTPPYVVIGGNVATEPAMDLDDEPTSMIMRRVMSLASTDDDTAPVDAAADRVAEIFHDLAVSGGFAVAGHFVNGLEVSGGPEELDPDDEHWGREVRVTFWLTEQ